MTDDLVARLRDPNFDCADEAADEITRLRADLAVARAAALNEAERAAVDAVNSCREDGETDLRSVRHRVGHAIRALKGAASE